MSDPRTTARRCFALAASTEHDGERTAAIGRGEAICAKHGLDLDDFDIPGRTPTKPRAQARGFDYSHIYEDRTRGYASAHEYGGSTGSRPFWGAVNAEEIFADIRRTTEAFYRAEAAVAAHAKRVSEAAEYLRTMGATVQSRGQTLSGESRYTVEYLGSIYDGTADDLLELADAIRAKRGE